MRWQKSNFKILQLSKKKKKAKKTLQYQLLFLYVVDTMWKKKHCGRNFQWLCIYLKRADLKYIPWWYRWYSYRFWSKVSVWSSCLIMAEYYIWRGAWNIIDLDFCQLVSEIQVQLLEFPTITLFVLYLLLLLQNAFGLVVSFCWCLQHVPRELTFLETVNKL